MYLAELHGKLKREQENQEDILTSNVFSFFKYADREIFLYSFLRFLDLSITKEQAQDAEFRFWPSFEDNTEPDLVIIVGSYYLLIEAKYHSGFGEKTLEREHQIVREISGGMDEAEAFGKVFRIVALTAHYSENLEFLREIPTEFQKHVMWMNWHTIAEIILRNLGDPSLRPETHSFASDLYDLFVYKNLRHYVGMNLLPALQKHLQISKGKIFFEASSAKYRGDFIGFKNTLPFCPVTIPEQIFYFQVHGFLNLLPIKLTIKPDTPIFFRRN